MRPSSRGSVVLRSADPADPPKILFNYTATEHDRQVMRDGIRHTREIFAQSAFDDLRGPELAPGPDAESDDALDAFVREKGESAYHPSCTCKMGTDEYSVVDAQGKLHGITGLRVVDASIMPKHRQRQPQRPGNHDGGEAGGYNTGQGAPASFRCRGVRVAGLADPAEISGQII